MLEQCLKNWSLWEAHLGSVGEGQHPVGGTGEERRSWKNGSDEVFETDCSPISLHHLGRGGRRGWMKGWCL